MKTSFVLTIIAAVLSVMASAAGLFLPGLYQDSEFLRTVWQGNDWVTLAFVMPAMIVTLAFYKKGSIKAELIRMGLLLYLFYNYAFYLFAAAFNDMFLLYVAIFTISAYALIYGLLGLPRQRLTFRAKYTSWIIGYLLLIAFILCMVEIPPIVAFMAGGPLPELIVNTGHPTSIVYALDLSIVVPLSVLAALWLWQGRQWGYVLAAMMLVKGGTYGMVLSVNTIILMATKAGGDPLLPFYLFVAFGGLGGLLLLISHTKVVIPFFKRNDV